MELMNQHRQQTQSLKSKLAVARKEAAKSIANTHQMTSRQLNTSKPEADKGKKAKLHRSSAHATKEEAYSSASVRKSKRRRTMASEYEDFELTFAEVEAPPATPNRKGLTVRKSKRKP